MGCPCRCGAPGPPRCWPTWPFRASPRSASGCWRCSGRSSTLPARNNLRRELSLLRATLGDEVLRTSGSQVAWNGQAGAWVDVAVFQAEVATGLGAGAAPLSVAAASALEHAARLAGDEFMAGFSLTDCPDFDEWQFFQREELRQQLARALPALSAWHGAQGAYDAALGYTRRWLALDPLHEPVHRELMRLYAMAGEHAAGRAQLRDALSEALATRLWPKVGFVLFQIALLRLAEADAGGDDQGRANAVELLAAVAAHPATWHVYRARAERLLDDPGARLPAELTGPAVARGRALDWGTDLGWLLEALQ